MAVGYRSSSHTGNDAEASSRAPAVPAGAAAGDVVVVKLSRWGGNPTVTAPSGFTQYPTMFPSGDGAGVIRIYWKRLTASDAGSYTFSWTGALWSHAHAVCFTGVISTGDPIEDVDGWAGTAGTFGSVSNETVTIPGLFWTTYNDSNGTHSPPTGFTEIIDNDCGSSAYRIAAATGTQTASGGSVTSSSPASAVLVSLKPEASGSTGTIVATISNLTAAITGASNAQGSMSPSLPGPSAALVGAGTAAGALAATLLTPTAALLAEGIGSGLLGASLPSALAALTATAATAATLGGSAPELQAEFDAVATAIGAAEASFPDLMVALIGTTRNYATLVAELPILEGGLTGIADTEDNLLLVVLPQLMGALTAEANSEGGLVGTLPIPESDIDGESLVELMLLDGLPQIEGQFFGVAFEPGQGQLVATLPMLTAITGRAKQLREQEQQRKTTRAFIMASPVDIALIPSAEQRTASGGVMMIDGVARPVQTFRLIPMSHTERPVASTSGVAGASGGVQRKYDMTLLGEWNSEFQENDYWFDEKGQKYVIDAVIPFNGYERKGLVMSYGRSGSIVD